MALKTYVLLDSMDSDAPIYQVLPDGKRMQLKKIPVHRPTLQQTFQDADGVSTTIRYKSNSNTIYQREQIDKEKLEANERFTTQERRDLEFKHGVLFTNKIISQTYLEAHPECDTFKGTCDDVRQPRYKVLDKAAESKIKNSDIRLRVKAANKILDLDLKGLQEMLIRLNGSFFQTPDDAEECQNMLMMFVDDAEEAGLNAVLKENYTIDEETSVLIGKLINAGTLSFDAVQGVISKKGKDGQWITVREMSNEYAIEERQRLFSDFLNTTDGKALKDDLYADAAAFTATIPTSTIKVNNSKK